MPPAEAHITVNNLTMAYGSFIIQRDLSFTVRRGDIFIIMGGSGCGKSTLLRHLIGLKPPAQGEVLIDGESLWTAPPEAKERLKRRCGVLFQSGALWSSMTLAENVALPLEQYTTLSPARIRQQVALKLALVGLASKTTTLRRSAAACKNVPAWPEPWRLIPISCFSMSPRRGSIRSAHGSSMN